MSINNATEVPCGCGRTPKNQKMTMQQGVTGTPQCADKHVMRSAPGLILVVEDERSLREPLVHLLQLRHFEVVTADTAEDALRAVRMHKPDAAIVDLNLKKGSGRDVVTRMPARTPVIIFSGTIAETGELERNRPRTILVEKPASLTWLINTLDEMLATSLPQPAPVGNKKK
jgi:DNA-binding NtrC family response regulator